MTPLEIARQEVLSAALSLASTYISNDLRPDNPHGGAQIELDEEVLDQAIGKYVHARQVDLEGPAQG